jgi:hypothetical protein
MKQFEIVGLDYLVEGRWALLGSSVDAPRAGERVDPAAVDLAGWALGERTAAVLEVWRGEACIRKLRVGALRTDVAALYPDVVHATRCGFRSRLRLDPGSDAPIELRLLFDDGTAVPFAVVRVRPAWRLDFSLDAPLVSIIVSCGGRTRDCADSIRSAADQDYERVEVVVISDQEVDTGRDARNHSSRVRRIGAPLAGPDHARGEGVRRSNGDLLVFLDPGDQLTPGAISEQVAQMRVNARSGLVIGAEASSTVSASPRRWAEPRGPADLIFDSSPRLAAILFRRELLTGCELANLEGCDAGRWLLELAAGSGGYCSHESAVVESNQPRQPAGPARARPAAGSMLEQRPNGRATSPHTATLPLSLCTIAARRELAMVSALATRLQGRNLPELFALVTDGVTDRDRELACCQLVAPEELGIRDLRGRAFRYDEIELAASFKAEMMRWLLDRFPGSGVLYLDPSSFVFGGLGAALRCLAEPTILLVPIVTESRDIGAAAAVERAALERGIFDAGFLGVGAGPEPRRFLDWWSARLESSCYRRGALGHYCDQSWLSFVPEYFACSRLLRDPAFGVGPARSNFNQLRLRGTDLLAGDTAIELLRMKAFDASAVGDGDGTGLDLGPPHPAFLEIPRAYARELAKFGHELVSRRPYAHDYFSHGVRIPAQLRQLFRELPADERQRFADPFDASAPESFLRWATTDAEDGSPAPFTGKLLAARPDVRAVFPEPGGRDRASVRIWARASAPAEMSFDRAIWNYSGDATTCR